MVSPTKPPLETLILEVGRELARTLVRVLDAIPGGPHRPQALARMLGVNTVLTSRILKAAQQHDPLLVAHTIPGPEPLRRLLRAAERRKVDSTIIREAKGVVDRFERLIDVEAGDRSSLDAIISGWLPEARERVELLAKQSMFRGISQLLGTACDVDHLTGVLYPSSSDPDRIDLLWLGGSQALRRVRPGLVVKFDIGQAALSAVPLLTVAGEPVEALNGLLLEQFCSSPLPHIEIKRLQRPGGDTRTQYVLSGEDVGPRSAVNLVYATWLPNKKERYLPPNQAPRNTGAFIGVTVPAKVFQFDLLVHEEIYPGQTPALAVYRTVFDGMVNPNDPSRELDRLEVAETLQSLGMGLTRFRSAEIPAYDAMLGHVCRERQWDGGRLRGFRCRIEYPIYSSQVVMSFELPPK
jgi:hypothetical protein